METTNIFSEEIIIVGSRYGELADVLNPLYKEGKTMEEEEITRMLGGDMVLLHPTQNQYDQYAVGVYTLSEQLLGYVWMYQSPSICDWLDDHHKEYLKARIRQVNTKYGFMMATPVKPVKLKYRERTSFSIDHDWVSGIPEVLPSITEQSLSLGIALLRDELEEAEAWSGSLQKRIDNLLRNLPLDLSAHRYMESMELYEMMKNSPMVQVREQSMLVLQSLVVRGSKDQMTWWVKHWLPDFFRDAAEGDLLGIYEAANYTLERVEGLLNGSPENLFYLFKVNRERFACRDCYHHTENMSKFERELMDLDYPGGMTYMCKEGTIVNTITRNGYMKFHVDKWESMGVKSRVLKLRDEFKKTLEDCMDED